jgi:multiple sugar transport system permease protein
VLWTLAPYLWLIISSFSYKIDLLTVPLHWIPQRFTLDNYHKLFFAGNETNANAELFVKSLRNSAVIAVLTTFMAVTLGIFAAYSLARVKFPGNNLFLLLMMGAQIVPPIAIVIPLYTILRRYDLLDKPIGLILVYQSFILPLVVWLLRGYFATIPPELEEAARIDGCTRIAALFRIVLPLALPGLMSVTIFAFIASWNEYLYAFIYTNIDAKTLPVLIGEFSTKLGLDYLRIAAAGVLASLPLVLLALAFQRFLIRGLVSGAVK